MGERISPITLDNYKPLRELVFEALREAIIQGRLHPGERLMEIQLAEELGVSRTPVREAIRKLELEGLVLMIPRKGAYVSEISMKDIADVFEIRRALEGLAARLAAERATEQEIERLERALVKIAEIAQAEDLDGAVALDTDFHEELMAASHNPRLSQLVSNLREQIQRFRLTSLSHPGRVKLAVEEHRKIVDAIASHDADLAQNLAYEHIENAENSLMEVIREAGLKPGR
ncbi:MAG TPA: GntR family transcriptional regulator [Firmicutes bacterium]|nr:GntR family transcriptional regulator [Bacillota bacterium]